MIDAIKRIVDNLLERKKLMIFEYGTVEEVSPLKIRIDQKHLLYEDDLKLSHLVKDYYVDITVQHSTDSIYGSWDTNHSHPNVSPATIPIDHEHEYKGRKKILIHSGLLKGEKVILLRQQGGQMYYVVDRVVEPTVQGEWI